MFGVGAAEVNTVYTNNNCVLSRSKQILIDECEMTSRSHEQSLVTLCLANYLEGLNIANFSNMIYILPTLVVENDR